MISLLRHDDVIFEKFVKQQASSTQILISIGSVSQVIIFLVHVTNIVYLFRSEMQNILNIAMHTKLTVQVFIYLCYYYCFYFIYVAQVTTKSRYGKYKLRI